jgi:hypothetical protein
MIPWVAVAVGVPAWEWFAIKYRPADHGGGVWFDTISGAWWWAQRNRWAKWPMRTVWLGGMGVLTVHLFTGWTP